MTEPPGSEMWTENLGGFLSQSTTRSAYLAKMPLGGQLNVRIIQAWWICGRDLCHRGWAYSCHVIRGKGMRFRQCLSTFGSMYTITLSIGLTPVGGNARVL